MGAADATLTQAQRQQAQDEVDRLLTASDGSSEIQQILDNVNYNGVKLLADSEKSAAVQAGAVGAAGGKREVSGVQGGDKVSLLSLTGSTTSASLALTTAVGALSGGNNFDHLTAANSPGLDLVGMEETKSGMLINMSVVGDTVQKGDILELTYKNKSGTTTDQVIVAAMYESAGGTHGQDDVVVFNAEGHTVGLDLYDLLTSTTGGITSLTDTFSISRIPQTLVLDSTGATAVSASGRNFDPGSIATTNNTHSEFREVMHVGVALKASGDSGSAGLNRVSISFADSNPLSAAAKIESAIEEQLGGEYRDGGALHIDVKAMADIYKMRNIDSTSLASAQHMQIAAKGEITQDLWDTTTNIISTGSFTNIANTTADWNGVEFVKATEVYFQFSTSSTAGVNRTPELRIMSDELAGYTDTTYPDRLFGNSLSIATGEHGNDKFMLTIDGEEVEVDLDGDFASSTAQRLSTLVTAEEKLTVDVSASASLNSSTFRIGIHDGDTVQQTIGLTAHDTSLAIGEDTHRSGLDYSIGNPTSRNYTGGYYSQDNLRSMLTDAINKATTSAADASVSYDHSTRTYTLTTGSRSNQSSLNVGKGVATNITLDNSASATSLVDSTPGTSGFVGALGLSENTSSTGSGSFFEFRLGGAGDTFSINFGTFGVTNMGADQIDISNITLATQSGAASAISVIETALDSISTTQTRIGAGINHMARRVNVMESHREALRGAKARIEEIDFTVETRNLASLQILLQSSTAALAQANIIPQTLLQLLA